MHIYWQKAERRVRIGRWPAIAATAWAAMVIAGVAAGRLLGRPVSLCLFRRVTGVPCAACGGTRGMLALAGGHPVQGWLENPLLLTLLLALGVMLGVRVALGRRMVVRLAGWERVAAWATASVAFAGNWAYVIVRGQ